MFEAIKRGWKIVEDSWSVLKRNPKLLVFPVVSGIATLVVVAAIALPLSQSDYMRSMAENVPWSNPVLYAVLFAFYFACSFVVIFFNAAMTFCTLECFDGKEPSIRAGLASAVGRLPQILGWTFVAATVGLILDIVQSVLSEKLGFIGELIGGLFEFAWSVATYFVVPVLVVEAVGPIEAIKRSSAILRRTWGEAVGGEGGLGIVSFLLMLPVIAVVAVVGFVFGVNTATIAALGAIVFLYCVVLAVVFSALSGIFRTAVYVYATTGQVPARIDPGLVQGAFHPK